MLSGKRRRRTVLCLAGLVGLVVAAAFAAAPAAGYVYWSGDNSISRSANDGTSVQPEFFCVGRGPSYGIALDRSHVYWTNYEKGTIGRARLNGTAVESEFITGASNPWGVAVSGGYVYWVNKGAGTIGRANLDGSEVTQEFIKRLYTPYEVVVNGQYIYWNSFEGSIGRASIDGLFVEPTFIEAESAAWGLALDSGHLYWVNDDDSISRANLDGTGTNPAFIRNIGSSQNLQIVGLAVDAHHVYWKNWRFLGRAGIAGGRPTRRFARIGGSGMALAVNSAGPPSEKRLSRPKSRRRCK